MSCSDGSPDDSGLGGEDQQGEGAEEEHGLDHGDGGGDDGGCRRAQETLPVLSSLGIFIERWPGPCLSPAPPAADISPEYTAVLRHARGNSGHGLCNIIRYYSNPIHFGPILN